VHGNRDAPPGLRNIFSHAPVADVATFAALAEHVGAVAGAINRTGVW
jgi:hypothetical protein